MVVVGGGVLDFMEGGGGWQGPSVACPIDE